MKCEPQGIIKLDDVNARHLGLVDATPLQLQLISATITTKPVSPTEAALSCLQIPIISKNVGVKYVDSKPPNLHTKMVTKSKILGFHPIDIYCAQPSNMAQYTFTKYWKQFSPQQQELKKKKCLGKDKLGFFVYKSEHLVRFTDFNPGKHVEPFFFNILLNNVVFFKECKLISPTNLAGSYYHECFVRGIVKTIDCLQDFISEYGKRNLYDEGKQNQMYNKLLEKHPFENSQNLPININIDITCVGSQISLVDPNCWIHDVSDSLENKILSHEQMHIFNIIFSKTNGLHVISGT
jgi:hypothetical protein